MLHDYQASYEPDMSAAIDKEHELIADALGVDIKTALRVVRMKERAVMEDQALLLGKVIGILLQSKNQPVALYSLAIAAGLDQLNNIKSETQVAEMFGVTRALVSHYTIGWRDLLSGKDYSFDITKIRKRNATRETYRKQATSSFLEAKAQALKELKQKNGGSDAAEGQASTNCYPDKK
jgi:predicted transcriptional regulator